MRSLSPPWKRGRPMRAWLGLACVIVPCAWAVGQWARDTWEWSQLLFWLPAPMVACAALCAALLLRRSGRAWGRVACATACAGGVWACVHTLWWSIGWGVGAAPATPSGADAARQVVIVHWNPRAPGESAAEHGRAILQAEGDISILSNPGHMLRGEHANEWVPLGWHVAETPFVGIVSRWPVRALRMVASPSGPPSAAMWAALAEIETVSCGTLTVLVVDFPSNPRLPRGSVEEEAAAWFSSDPAAAHPDILVGDFNSIEGSRLFEPWPTLAPPRPWRCVGWLGTFPRAFPLLRIDWMRVGPELQFERYETLNLGTGLHRAQRAIVSRAKASTESH